jgi:hypothetical protein
MEFSAADTIIYASSLMRLFEFAGKTYFDFALRRSRVGCAWIGSVLLIHPSLRDKVLLVPNQF